MVYTIYIYCLNPDFVCKARLGRLELQNIMNLMFKIHKPESIEGWVMYRLMLKF